MDPEFVDTIEKLREFLHGLPSCNEKWPNLYIDLEGNDLSRKGTLSLLTVLVESRRTVCI